MPVQTLAQPSASVMTTARSNDPVLAAEIQVLTMAMEKTVANVVAQSEINTDLVRRLLALEHKFAQLSASPKAHRGS
jgi:hypothetical protein